MPQSGGKVMELQAKRKIRMHIRNIIEISVFLVVTTWFWYGPRIQLQEKSALAREAYAYISGVELEDKNSILINEDKRSGEYIFTIKNNTNSSKEVLVKLGLDYNRITKDRCNTIDYNYVHYYLSPVGGFDLTERILSINGDILVTTLQPLEIREYSLKYFVHDDQKLSKKHFHTKAILSNGQNL